MYHLSLKTKPKLEKPSSFPCLCFQLVNKKEDKERPCVLSEVLSLLTEVHWCICMYLPLFECINYIRTIRLD